MRFRGGFDLPIFSIMKRMSNLIFWHRPLNKSSDSALNTSTRFMSSRGTTTFFVSTDSSLDDALVTAQYTQSPLLIISILFSLERNSTSCLQFFKFLD
jgi:hypothetical protein